MRKRLAAEFAISVYEDGKLDFDMFDRYLWRRIHEGPAKALSEYRRRRGRKRRRSPAK